MAKRKPKLGDVEIRDDSSLDVFCDGEWWFIRKNPRGRNPIVSKRRFQKLFTAIIREARETRDGKA